MMKARNKKGAEFAVGTIIMIVLGLVVLIILIVVIRQQVTKGASKYTEISDDVTTTGGCYSLLEGRSCIKATTCPPDMTRVDGRWPDCEEKAKKANTNYVCCKSK